MMHLDGAGSSWSSRLNLKVVQEINGLTLGKMERILHTVKSQLTKR